VPVTPRAGKPVEVNALWIEAVGIAASLTRCTSTRAHSPSLVQTARHSCVRRFVRADGGGLYDVVDGPGGNDSSVRPNQLLAVSLTDAVLPADAARDAVDACRRSLLTPTG